MTSPQRVAWVERKFAEAGVKKVIPPNEVDLAELSAKVRDEIDAQVVAEALRDKRAWIDQENKKRFSAVRFPADLTQCIANYLKTHRSKRWTEAIDTLVHKIVVGL